MTKADPHDAAAQALRATLQGCVRKQIAELERKGRNLRRLDLMGLEAREYISQANELRKQAEKAGLV